MSAKEAMTRRERVLAAINHQPVDRVPTDLWGTAEVMAKLRRHFGDGVDIAAALHVDGIAGVGAKYIGPPPPAVPAGQSADMWGMVRKTVTYETGEYSELVHCPLAAARTIDDLERYRWPSPDWFDYSQMRASAEKARQHQAVLCGYMTPFYMHNLLRGLEQSLMDPLDDPAFTHHFLERLSAYLLEHHRRMFQACVGLIDLAQVTDDYGSQNGPMISLKVFREFYLPHLRRYADLCHEFGIKVFHHDDGGIRPFLPDLIGIGVAVLNPVQWVCPGMELTALKRDFGAQLCFHGGVDNQRILPFGTPDEVRAEVRHCIDTLASDHTGYILGPCHNIQAVSPVENILAMYDEAYHYGRWG